MADNDNNVGAEETQPQADDAAAEEARAQADARRKRILEKANKRLGVVSGEMALGEDEKKQSAEKAARIRAARQRRYGKKAAATVDKEADTDQEAEEKVDEPKAEEVTSTEGTTETDDVVVETKEDQEPPKQEEVESSNEATSKEEPKKKYMGVARMRRHMMQRKKQEEASKQETMEADTEVEIKETPSALIPPKVLVVPIYMHMITILLLFLAGVDVGIQQHHEEVKIHDRFAIVEHGIPFVHRSPWDKQGVTPKTIQDLQGIDGEPYLNLGYQDEFKDATELEQEPNIDPIFRVDLDELTKGPGMLNQLARGAVAIHRMILLIVWYAPISFFMFVVSIPQALMQTPPALCFVALILRQIVGKGILRAGIPIQESDNNAIDVLAMAKNWLANLLNSAFPTAVGMYDAFTHLRSDMYIVICGVFCGLAWAHLSAPFPLLEELIPVEPTEESVPLEQVSTPAQLGTDEL